MELSGRSELPSPVSGNPVPPGGWDRPITAPPPPGIPAGWGKRLAAALVDAAIVAVPAGVVAAVLAAVLADAGLFGDGGAASVVVGIAAVIGVIVAALLVLLIATLIYAPLLMRRTGDRNGQTWGKQLMGIRVTRSNGDPQTLASAALREGAVKVLAFGLVSALLLYVPTLLDGLWPLWDREKRALHDILADSRVVHA